MVYPYNSVSRAHRQVADEVAHATYHQTARWIWSNMDEYRNDCNEVDLTTLSEAAAEEFGHFLDDAAYTIPEWVFHLTSTLAELRETP